uniref:Uncharacterized protein n=1 Tax=Oryza barthii TaxID=65489 RepID=A0A0D3HNS1_9ORYZ
MSTPTEHASECASGSSQRYSFSSLHFTSLEKERRCRSGHEFCERYHLSPVLSCPRKKKKKKEKKKGRRKTDDHEVVHVI